METKDEKNIAIQKKQNQLIDQILEKLTEDPEETRDELIESLFILQGTVDVVQKKTSEAFEKVWWILKHAKELKATGYKVTYE